MTISNKIEGTIRLISPMHCATVDSTESTDGKNITFTHQQMILTANGSQRVPYFPGNDLRGRLRRKAAALVMDQITATQKVKVDLYAGLMSGSITNKPESDLSLEEALRARDNVYMGLFGGGTRLLRSRYCANDLMPVIQSTIDAGIVPAHFAAEGAPQGSFNGVAGPLVGYHLLQARTSLKMDDIGNALSPDEMAKYIENSVEAVAAKQSTQLAASAERKADKAAAKAGEISKNDIAKKSGGSNLFAVQSILRGTQLHCLIDLQNDVSDAHVGLLLLALQALVREQALGGWIRCGYGRYSANLNLTRNGQTYAVFVDGQNAADATLTDEVQNAFCAPARKALETLTAESMMEFFAPRASEDEDKPAKGKKAAKVSTTEAA